MSEISVKNILIEVGSMKWAADNRATEQLAELLDGISPEQAQRHLSGDLFSIEEVLQHLTHWKAYYTHFINGDPVDELGPRLPDDGSAPENMPGWPEIIDELERVERNWIAAVKSVSDKRLTETHPQNRFGLDIARVIALMGLHDAYHIGQIYAIKSMLSATQL